MAKFSNHKRYQEKLESDEDVERYEAELRKTAYGSSRNGHGRIADTSKEDDLDELRQKSRMEMDNGYQAMIERYQEHQGALKTWPAWVDIKTRGAKEPHDLTVTHINQTADLLKVSDVKAANQEVQTTDEWLDYHGLEAMKLTLKHLVLKGQIQRPLENSDKKIQQHLQFEGIDINDFEYKLTIAIEKYTNRIKWLLQGSRRMFGLLKGDNLTILLDISEANCNFGRLSHFKQCLMHLLDDQLPKHKSLYLASFGSQVSPLWPQMMDVNYHTLEEAKEWVNNLEPQGGCNLLGALKNTLKLKDIDRVLLVLGSVPDQNVDVLSDYVEQLVLGRKTVIDTVSFDCNNQQTNRVLMRLSEYTEGRYHCYSTACEEQIYTGNDICRVLKEIQAAQGVLNKIREMRQGLLGTALVTVMNEINKEVNSLPPARFLPHPVGHDLPLSIRPSKFTPTSSTEWLKKNGLKAQGLDLYQVLAPNAYAFCEEFVPVIRKTVQSQVHERSMTQFEWHDGSIKNVHVDMAQLFEYQKQLGASVKVFEKRIEWLTSHSRKIFGSVAENRVMFLVDVSKANTNYLVHIQHSLRLILEEQMVNREFFNIIAFGDEVQQWQPCMRRPSPEHLQAAWKWILGLQCKGSRNFMAAFRAAVENEEEKQHGIEVDGVYLLTSGIPDQNLEVCTMYEEDVCCGRDLHLHIILFNVDDYDANGPIASRYANITKTAECLRTMAHCTDGRFHWFRETGIIESDDIAAVSLEIEKALNYSKKAAYLVAAVKQKYGIDGGRYGEDEDTIVLKELPQVPAPYKALPMPKHTALSETRVKQAHAADDPDGQAVEPLSGWRPSSAKKESDGQIQKDGLKKVGTKKKASKAFFYTESGNRNASDYIGSVYDKFAHRKMSRKVPLKLTDIPKTEDLLTTKEWLKMYSLSKLKLDLDRLVMTLDCKHGSTRSTHEHLVEAKHCTVFPTINVAGKLKHLQMTKGEVKIYIDQLEFVLKRYLHRLQWLLSGCRRVFGTVVEKNVVILIDTSGSMEPVIEELRKELVSLIWEHIFKHCIKFNLIRFSRNCERWKSAMVEPTKENCHEAVQWTAGLMANGNTCTLEALQMAFEDKEVEAVYLLTDGKPDSSTALVLQEVATMNTQRNIPINTIAYYCQDSVATNFLKMLATQTSGRYHTCGGHTEPQLFAHKLLTEGFSEPDNPPTPEFEGQDLQRLGREITAARMFLKQARNLYESYNSFKTPADDPHDCFNDQNETVAKANAKTKQRPASAKTVGKNSRTSLQRPKSAVWVS